MVRTPKLGGGENSDESEWAEGVRRGERGGKGGNVQLFKVQGNNDCE